MPNPYLDTLLHPACQILQRRLAGKEGRSPIQPGPQIRPDGQLNTGGDGRPAEILKRQNAYGNRWQASREQWTLIQQHQQHNMNYLVQ